MQIAGQDAELPEIRHRTRYLAGFVLLVFLVLAGRLFYLQVVQGDTFYKITADSIVRTVELPAARGQIKDRKGRPLATTRPSFDVEVNPTRITFEVYARLRGALASDASAAAADALAAIPSWQALKEAGRRQRNKPIIVAQDIPRDAMATLESGIDNPGLKIVAAPRRHYPEGTLAAHALGYLNEINADELRARQDEGYRSGDLIGRTGIERQWEAYLRGTGGFEKVVVDRRGLRRSDLRIEELVDGPIRTAPVNGNDVILTIDADLQRISERALRATRAAALVVLEVETGRILALASRPSFDPNVMSGGLSATVQARLTTDPLRPFRDKAVSETYNPGSTFKAVSALTALEERLITPDDRARCRGYVELGRRRFRCTKAHGVVALHGALVHSCNVYFYELGGKPLMLDRLARFATELGLGAPAGLGLNGEQPGFVPTEGWHRKQAARDPNQGSILGHSLNTAIGEGSTRVTVLQMALLYAAIASGGRLWLPQVVERIEASGGGQVIEEFPPRVRRDVAVSAESLALVRRGLAGVVNERGGTAFRVRSQKVMVAGKTGTAHVHQGARRGGVPRAPWQLLNHAWFAGYAPASQPRIAFAVIVEHGGHGGDVAAPIAMEIVDGYFETVAPLAPASPGPPTAAPPVRAAAGPRQGRAAAATSVPGGRPR